MGPFMSQSMSLFPHQRVGVDYLKSSPKHALLFDEQRVGKTPQMIVASGELGLDKVLVVTTVAGVGVWQHQWKQWDTWGRTPVIVPWSRSPPARYDLELSRNYNLLILDECHYAKNPRRSARGAPSACLIGDEIIQAAALVSKADRVWCATGTPMTHDPGDLFLTLKALFPEILEAHNGFPDVSTFTASSATATACWCRSGSTAASSPWWCVARISTSCNGACKGRFIRRRQKDVGIRPAFWDTMPFPMMSADRAELEVGRSTRRRDPRHCSAATGPPPSAAWPPSAGSPVPSRRMR